MASLASRRWCFTVNNYTDSMLNLLLTLSCVYLVVGREVSESGTPHLQCFVVFETTKRLSGVKKIAPSAHWEVARGTTEQASVYCMKEGSYTETGVRPNAEHVAGGAAEKERWDVAKKRAREGDLDDIPSDIFIKYYRTLKEIAKDYMPAVDDLDYLPGIWIYGPAGCGKSRTARLDYPGAYFKLQNKWWDGYQGEENVILDDYDCKELGHHLKIWGDRYAFIAETKGGAIKIRPKRMIITSNYSISAAKFDWDADMIAALERRYTQVNMCPDVVMVKDKMIFM